MLRAREGGAARASLSLTMFGCDILRSDCTSRSCMHSSQLKNFFFIRLIATISPVVLLTALCTLPYVPSPSGLMVL